VGVCFLFFIRGDNIQTVRIIMNMRLFLSIVMALALLSGGLVLGAGAYRYAVAKQVEKNGAHSFRWENVAYVCTKK